MNSKASPRDGSICRIRQYFGRRQLLDANLRVLALLVV